MTVWQPRLVHWLKFNAVGAIGICVQLSVLAMLRSGFGWNYLLSTAAALRSPSYTTFYGTNASPGPSG
jgi:putative flippase GtrA